MLKRCLRNESATHLSVVVSRLLEITAGELHMSLVVRAAIRLAERGELPMNSFVTLKVYDVLGSEVKNIG